MKESQVAIVQCFTCGSPLQVSTAPVRVNVLGKGWQLVPPKLAAPFICGTCRKDPVKLGVARGELAKYIGPAEEQEGFER